MQRAEAGPWQRCDDVAGQGKGQAQDKGADTVSHVVLGGGGRSKTSFHDSVCNCPAVSVDDSPHGGERVVLVVDDLVGRGLDVSHRHGVHPDHGSADMTRTCRQDHRA